MRRSGPHWIVALGVVLAVVGAACSAGESAGGSEPESKAFKVAYGGIGISTVPMLVAIDRLNAEGWTIEGVEISASELAVQAVASNEVQIARGSTPAAAAAVAQGADVRIAIGSVRNEWTLYSNAGITSCAELDGKKLAIHSEGSVSGFMVRAWIAAECPDAEPEYIILPGSENRFAALLANQIDASPIELADAVALEAKGGDKYRRLTSFAETLPFLETELEVNTKWAAANDAAFAVFLKTLIEENRKFTTDAAYFKEQVTKYLPGVDASTLDAVVAAYQDLDIMSSDGGIESDKQTKAINFMVEFGMVPPGLAADRLYDRSFLDAALKQLGS